jgi:spermidine/putrescine transport system substrate-binding protein
MMKTKLRFVQFFLLVIILGLSACSPATIPAPETPEDSSLVEMERELNIFNWDDYIDEAILADFEEKYDVTINYTTFTSNEDLIAVLMEGPVEYDLVVPSDYAVEFLRNESIFGALDKNNIPNFENISNTFVNPTYDPGNRYCIPYQWGTTGIGYNIQATGKEIQSWGDVYDPEFEGRVSLLDEKRETFASILLHLGYSPNTTNQVEIDEAANFLKSHAAKIAVYAPDTGQNLLVAGEVDVALEYSGDVFQVMEDNPDIRYVIPSEGAMLWSDNVCLLAKAPHKEIAEQFLNYLLEPEVGAALSNYLRYATPNQAALPLVNEADRNDPGLYPPDDVLARMFFFSDVGSANQLYEDAWNDVLSSHGE